MVGKREGWMMVALVLFGGLPPLVAKGITNEEWTILNSSWFRRDEGRSRGQWCGGIKLEDPVYALSVAQQWKSVNTDKKVGEAALKHITLTRASARLWTSMLYHNCTEEALKKEENKDKWCRFAKPGTDGESLAIITCLRSSAETLLEAWFNRTKDEGVIEGETDVHFSPYAAENASWRCPDKSSTKAATEKMPQDSETISNLSCTRMNPADKETAEPKTNRSKCFYNMTWLNDTVGYYSCDVGSASNCEETIKDTFEEGRVGSFKDTDVTIVEGQGTGKQADWKRRACTLKAELPAPADTKLKRFTLDGSSDQGEEIWCTFPGEPGGVDKITCRLLSPCEVKVREGFIGQWQRYGPEDGIDYEKGGTGEPLPNKCTPKGGSEAEGESTKKFTLEDKKVSKDEIWCTSTGQGGKKDKISCRRLSPCEVAVATKFKDQWENIARGSKIKYKGGTSEENTLPPNCSSKATSQKGDGSTRKFEFTGGSDSEKSEFWCVSPATDKDGISCKLLSPCEVKVREELNDAWMKDGVETKIEYEDGTNKGNTLPQNCTPKEKPDTGSTKKFKFENDAKEFWCALGKEGNTQKIECKPLTPCEVVVREELKNGWKKDGVETRIEYKCGASGNNQLPPNCSPKDTQPVAESTKKFTSTDEKEFWCTFHGQVGAFGEISCKSLTPCEVKVREKFWTACNKVDITKKLDFDGGETEWADLPKECSSDTENTAERHRDCLREPKNLTFKVEKEPADLTNRKFTCQMDQGSHISCTLHPPTCEEMVQQEYKAKSSGHEGKSVNFEGDIEELSRKGGQTTEDNCPLKEIDSQTCGTDKIVKFQITGEADKKLEGRRISCTSSGDGIKCDLLPPTCEEYVGEEFRGKCGEDKAKAESVEFEKAISALKSKGGDNLEDYCPLQHTDHPKHKDKACKGNNGNILVFKIANGTNSNRDVMCNFTDSTPGVTCKLLPLTCEEEVKARFGGKCKGECKEVKFEGISELKEKGGSNPDDTCPIHGDNSPSQNEGCETGKAVKFTTLVENMNRTVSCKLDSTSQISCKLLPKTCAQFVQTEFNTTCGKRNEIEGLLTTKQDFTNFGTLTLPREEDEKCPLQLSPVNQENCKKGENTLTFMIEKGNETNKTLSCTFENSQISCKVLPLTCAQVIQKELLGYHHHRFWDFLYQLVSMKGESKLELNETTCNKTEENHGDGKSVFDVIKGEGEKELQNRTEISCKKDKEPNFSCSILPPRCKIEKYKRDDEENTPLRCDKTGENITISSASFENKGKLECKKEQPTNNTERNVTCEVSVKNIGETVKPTPFYCNKEEAKILGSNVCEPLSLHHADNCTLHNLTFPTDSTCNITEKELSIPGAVYVRLLWKLKTVTDHCRVEQNTYKQAENKCLITIKNENGENYYHCDNEKVKEIQEKLKEACEPDKIPRLSHYSPSSHEKTVKIRFQPEEHNGDETPDVMVRKIRLFHEVPSFSGEWDDYDENFTSFSHFPLPSLSFLIPSFLALL